MIKYEKIVVYQDYIPQKSMNFRDTILSDHEWSEDDDDVMKEEFVDHDDEDEIMINDLSNQVSETIKAIYRVRKSMKAKFY